MILIPQHTEKAIRAYADEGIPPGGFLYAVLTNDLAGAVGRADPENKAALANIVGFIHWEIPSDCHGTPAKVAAWLDKHATARATP